MTVKRIRDLFKGVNSDKLPTSAQTAGQTSESQGSRSGGGPGAQPPRKDGLLDLFENTSIRHNFRLTWDPDTLQLTAHTISVTSGSIPITDNWNVRIGNIGYDFASKRITYPDFSFSRNLTLLGNGCFLATSRICL